MRHEQLQQKIKQSRIFNNIVAHFGLDKKSVLDVGCSEGHYLEHFGPGSVGITIIDEHVTEGKGRGLSIINRNVEDPHFSLDETFDVVWANNIFEHLNAPHLFLRKMEQCLNDEGILILGVPIIPHIPFLDRHKKFRGAYAGSHINFFTRKTLVKTVQAAGWTVHAARLFYTRTPAIDWLFNSIAPHIYIIATPRRDFKYGEKRLRSLRGYTKHTV